MYAVFQAMSNNLKKDYILTNRLHNSISEELSYFFSEDYVRVNVINIEFDEEYGQKINDMSTNILKK